MSTLLYSDNRHTAIDKYPASYGSGSLSTISGFIDQFLNSSIRRDDSTTIILKENIEDDNLIMLKEKFNTELVKFKEVSYALAIKTFDKSLFYVSKISPEKITIEVTNDDSLYFSMTKNNFSIYLEEYVDDGEVIVTLFKDNVKQNSLSGNISYVTSRLQEVLSN